MDPERWQNIKKIVVGALDRAPEERTAYLAGECGNDTAMLHEVQSLVVSYEAAGDLFDAPKLEQVIPLAVEEKPPSALNRRIGPYLVVEEVGEGGMGTVYRAVRADDAFRKQVAIKLVKPGMDYHFILRRFRRERQIMANLEHPNIARLLDGGTTDEGLPYFVMEYVKGQPIDVYCDARKLSTSQRLELFRVVCSAVESAHQKHIVHRDIKPSNILVTEEGVPKLLDFGIAKITESEIDTQPVDPTLTVMRLMTPEYASPEQIRGEPVTVATDIYSLGVLLYELLTGHRPYRLKSRAPHEIARVICEEEPEKPSTAVNRVEEITRDHGNTRITLTCASVSEARGCPPEALRKALSGDLDNILLKAMRKEPGRRYVSVEEFSADLRRHLEGRPVIARKGTLAYRAAKFLQRHKGGVLTGAVAVPLAAAVVVVGLFRTQPTVATVTQPTVYPFTSLPGDETQASFSPDGKKVTFVWGGDNDENFDVYVKPVGDDSLTRITTDRAEDRSPTWSPDGKQIAFLHSSKTEATIFLTPADGGAQGKLADVYPTRLEAVGRSLAWSRDGQYLAVPDKDSPNDPFRIVLVSVADGRKSPLTTPPPGSVGDTAPAFSPDGLSLSFIRAPSSGVTDVYVISLRNQETRRLTFDNRDTLSQTWTADSRSIIFSSSRRANLTLWRVPAGGGNIDRVPAISENALDPSFSEDGHRVLYSQAFLDTNVWELELANARKAAGEAKRRIFSTQYDSSPQFSPDGRRIAFRSNRSGTWEIWVCDSEGKNALQLTHFEGTLAGTPRWSPDGQFIAFDSRPEGQPEIYVIASEGGEPRRLTSHPSEDVVPSWSRDGKWIYFASMRTGAWQVWKVSPRGGEPTQITRESGFAAFESPDGKDLYYAKGRSVGGLWKMSLPDGPETLLLEDLKPGYWGYWAVVRDGIYFVGKPADSKTDVVQFYDFQNRRITPIAPVRNPVVLRDSAFAVSPDGKKILFTQIDHRGSDIMLVENFPSGW